MIKEKKQCIKFQRAKAAKVKEFCNIKYHTKKDEKAIKKMDDERFLKAWEKIKANVFSGAFSGSLMTQGLTAYVCIFCMYHYDESDKGWEHCHNCGYGENHRICESANSDWTKIMNHRDYSSQKCFPNKFYRDLLNKVMEEKA